MIEGKGICKSFDGFWALDHLDFHVPKGAVYGLVGPNGAGKSTLLRCAMGIFKTDEGELLVGGEGVFENPSAKGRMVFIPDEIFSFRTANVVDMKNYYKSIYPAFDEKIFEGLKGCFPEIDEKKHVRKMSKGMQKQVAFWISISCKPEVILLDEPVDGLDPVMRRQVWNILLEEVAKREMTVLVSSHNLRELEDVCDHVGFLNKGKMVLEKSLESLQGSISKIQMAFEGECPKLEELDVLHHSDLGRVHTFIIRGDFEAVKEKIESLHPIFMDVLPLTLEEVFIYEMGGEDYAVKEFFTE
ncbi:MAG: ABC transporter ATP-binding protein [Lachnospiraceae bacterium]|nr:ABC transporter ATP-binding protein [Lachnospiraceae bacterium]